MPLAKKKAPAKKKATARRDIAHAEQRKAKAKLDALRRKQKLEGLLETLFLLSSPKNAARLRSALEQAKAGKLVEHGLDDV
jgi:hypothetical protein